MIKVWVTGSKGQLGTSISEQQGELPEAAFLFTDIEELDLTIKEDVLAFTQKEKPDWIINCAAYTAVDKAEEDADTAFLLNRDIPANLTATAKATGARLIHISTDFVFGGDATRPYLETDEPAPASVYAKSKYAGEQEVLKYDQNIIVRTSWLYSVHGNNFVKTMLRLGRERDALSVVSDQQGAPTAASDLVSAILTIISKVRKSAIKPQAIYHYSNKGNCSWQEFAAEIMKQAALNCKVNPISTKAYGAPAERPAYSVMNLRRIEEDFGLVIPRWRVSLGTVLTRLDGIS